MPPPLVMKLAVVVERRHGRVRGHEPKVIHGIGRKALHRQGCCRDAAEVQKVAADPARSLGAASTKCLKQLKSRQWWYSEEHWPRHLLDRLAGRRRRAAASIRATRQETRLRTSRSIRPLPVPTLWSAESTPNVNWLCPGLRDSYNIRRLGEAEDIGPGRASCLAYCLGRYKQVGIIRDRNRNRHRRHR